MEEIKENEKCFAEGCDKKQVENQFFCKKHLKSKAKVKVPGIKGFDNTTTKV